MESIERKPMMAGNWKMNNTISEAVVLAQEISNQYEKNWDKLVEIIVCPPFVDLKPIKTVFDFDRSKIGIASQNVYWEEKGAFTGEISVPMIKEIGCSYSIVGHSERRELFGETDVMVNKKIKALLAGGVGAIVCVGESLAVRDEGTTLDFIKKQIIAAFAGLTADEIENCVIAYEPIWAIGTGRTATPVQAEEVCAAIRQTMQELFGEECAEALRILYGGSMNPGNVEDLLAMENIDGGLVGGASLEARSFVQLIEACVHDEF